MSDEQRGTTQDTGAMPAPPSDCGCAPSGCCTGGSTCGEADGTSVCGLAWVDGTVSTPAGDMPRVSTRIGLADQLGTLRRRLGSQRMNYTVPPGLYAVGAPDLVAPVLVTANYKLSFDRVRAQLVGRDAWILVLDTQGVNVWCAAGKGTFGTAELIGRIASTGLSEVVSHRRLILPQLGATGVCAHQVKASSGFGVRFGPVDVRDLPAYLDAGSRATAEMRRVRFPLAERLVLIPVEIAAALKLVLLISVGLLLLSGLGPDGYSLARITSGGVISVALLFASLLMAAILVPLLLPWLPGHAFALKGVWVGAAGALIVYGLDSALDGLLPSAWALAAWMVFMPALASFVGMNFTGASTFTSLSGVLKEMRVAVPVQIVLTIIALGLWIAGLFLGGAR